MKYFGSHLGFTLVELIVGITISMTLMVGVGIFVSGGIQNIFLQQKVFENSGDFVEFNTHLQRYLDDIDISIVPGVSSESIVFKTHPYFARGGFGYIGVSSIDSLYCSDSENPSDDTTDHLYIKRFVPFFESGESSLSDIREVSHGGFQSFAYEHSVRNAAGDIVVGKQTFGSRLGSHGTGTYLNTPTGLALDGDILYISDTLNHRVLAYDTQSHDIQVLLDRFDGLREPTGLFVSGDRLLVSNSGKGEILEYSSSVMTNFADISLDFLSSYSDVATMDIELFRDDTQVDISFLSEDNIGGAGDDYFMVDNNNTGQYWFVGYQSISNISECPSSGKRLVGGRPVNCTQSGSGRTSYDQTSTLNSLDIDGIAGLAESGNYYFKISLFNASDTLLYENYFPYITQGDGDLLTADDNTLTVLASRLSYPNGIWGTDLSSDVATFDPASFANYTLDPLYDVVLQTPLKDFQVDVNNELLTLSGSYYKNYDCYNEDIRISRDFIWKKSLR